MRLTREEKIAKWKLKYEQLKEWEQDQLCQLEFLKARAKKMFDKYLSNPSARSDMVASLEKAFELMEECHDLMEKYSNTPYKDCNFMDIADKIREAVLWDNCVFQLDHKINSAVNFSLVVLEVMKNSSDSDFSQEELEAIHEEILETREAFSLIQAIYQNIAAREFEMHYSWLRNNGHRTASDLFFGLYLSEEN